jgi:hypothetical protein
MAELLVCFDYKNMLFQFNVTHERDGGIPNSGWEHAGWFPSIHEGLLEGKNWWNDAKANGFKRGANSVPRIYTKAA